MGGDGRRWEEVGGDGRRWEEVGGGERRWEVGEMGGWCGASVMHACMCGCECIPLKKVQ